MAPNARLLGGSSYSGDIQNGLFHGEGAFTYPDELEGMGSLSGTREEEIGMEESNWSYPQYHLCESLRQGLSQGVPDTAG